MLTASNASLNRFPGLTLKAWVLVAEGAIVKGFNVASVESISGTKRINFVVPIAGSAGVVDAQAGEQSIWLTGKVSADGGSVTLESTNSRTGEAAGVINNFYAAVYQ